MDSSTNSPLALGTETVRVLVTGAGGPAAVALLRGLDDGNVVLFAGDIDPHAAGLYLVAADRRLILPRGDDADFATHIQRICRDLGIDVLIPTVDSELIPVAEVAARLGSAGTRTVLADLETLQLCLDKLVLARHCAPLVPVPLTTPLDESFNASTWSMPFIVKPRSGSGGRGVRLVRSEEDLVGIERDGSYIVQEYLPGEEYSVDVFSDQNMIVRAAVPRLRLKVDSGVAVAGRTVHDPELEDMARAVATCIGLRYVANVQLRRDVEGTPHLLEVNPRFPGTMPLTIRAGVNMPRLALMAAQGFTSWPDDMPFTEVAMVRHWQEVFLEPRTFSELREAEPLAASTSWTADLDAA